MNGNGQQGFDQMEGLFTRLYLEAFPLSAAFIGKRGGSLEQAKDLFQDALIIYYEQVYTVGGKVPSSEKAYLLGIVKHLWYSQTGKMDFTQQLEALDSQVLVDIEEPQPSDQKLLSFLEAAGRRCMEVLKAFYYDNLPLSKISDHFGFSGTRSATVQKFKCLEKVRDKVKERKLEYADFTE